MADSVITNSIWIFHGENGRFSSGVFTTFELADDWIKNYKLTGVLTEYPLNIGVYDWAIREDLFAAKDESQQSPQFIQRFTSASQQHFHYEQGKIE